MKLSKITKPIDYLKKYSDKYRTARIPELMVENGKIIKFVNRSEQEVVIRMKIKSPFKIEPNFYHIWLLDDINLCATLPNKMAEKRLKEYPQFFIKRYSCEDRTELIFKEINLDNVAKILKIRTKRILSPELKQKATERLIKIRNIKKQIL